MGGLVSDPQGGLTLLLTSTTRPETFHLEKYFDKSQSGEETQRLSPIARINQCSVGQSPQAFQITLAGTFLSCAKFSVSLNASKSVVFITSAVT